MSEDSYGASAFHSHVFLGEGHEASERRDLGGDHSLRRHDGG